MTKMKTGEPYDGTLMVCFVGLDRIPPTLRYTLGPRGLFLVVVDGRRRYD